MIELNSLGNKICIIGCSNGGKSTLAKKLSLKLNIPAYHLDKLAHYPHSNWLRKPDAELIAAHSNILKENKWIIDGNYSVCMPKRIHEANSIIWLDTNVLISAFHYLICTIKNNPDRAGNLIGSRDKLKLFMLRQILFVYPKNRLKYQKLIEDHQKLVIPICNRKTLNQYYQYWNL